MSQYNITPAEKFGAWEKKIKEIRSSGKNIYIVGDTETTGGVSSGAISVFEKAEQEYRGKRHRIIEMGFIFCVKDEDGLFIPIKDNDGDNIFFHEYINPYAEDDEKKRRLNSIDGMPNSAFHVHGISIDFLFGKGYMDGLKLEKPAPTIQDVVLDFLKLTTVSDDLEGDVYGVFHNAPFDFTFMDSELENCEDEFGNKVIRFQDLVIPYDTINFFKAVLSMDELVELKEKAGVKKGKYSLDTLREIFTSLGYMNNENIDRTLHGAYKDSLLLIELYNGVQRYLIDKNQALKKTVFQKRKEFSDYSIVKVPIYGKNDTGYENKLKNV